MFVDCRFGDLFAEVDFAQNLVVDCRKIVKNLDPPLPPPPIWYTETIKCSFCLSWVWALEIGLYNTKLLTSLQFKQNLYKISKNVSRVLIYDIQMQSKVVFASAGLWDVHTGPWKMLCYFSVQISPSWRTDQIIFYQFWTISEQGGGGVGVIVNLI